MACLLPKRSAALRQPCVEVLQRRLKARHPPPNPPPCILHVLLYPPFLPSRRRVAELRLAQEMTDQRLKPGVDGAPFAAADFIDRCLHVVVNPALRNLAQRCQRMIMRILQHLLRLQGVRPQHEGAAETQLELGNLQLGASAPDDHPFLAPIKLTSFSRRKGQGHIHPPCPPDPQPCVALHASAGQRPRHGHRNRYSPSIQNQHASPRCSGGPCGVENSRAEANTSASPHRHQAYSASYASGSSVQHPHSTASCEPCSATTPCA